MQLLDVHNFSEKHSNAADYGASKLVLLAEIAICVEL